MHPIEAQSKSLALNLANNLFLSANANNMYVGRNDIHALINMKADLVECVDSRISKVLEMAITRCSNLDKYGELDVLSLGFDCLGRTVPTRWGLKKPKSLGEKTGPFDLAVHDPETVCTLISSQFEGYLQSVNLLYSDELGYCLDRSLNVSFNHEIGRAFADDDFSQLRNVYWRRVKSFTKTLSTEKPLMLIGHVPTYITFGPDKLCKLIELRDMIALSRSNPTHMLIISSCKPDACATAPDLEREGFNFWTSILPDNNYIWHLPDCILSDEGFEWEKSLIDRLSNIMKRYT